MGKDAAAEEAASFKPASKRLNEVREIDPSTDAIVDRFIVRLRGLHDSCQAAIAARSAATSWPRVKSWCRSTRRSQAIRAEMIPFSNRQIDLLASRVGSADRQDACTAWTLILTT